MLQEGIHAAEQAWIELQQEGIWDFSEIHNLNNAGNVPIIVCIDLNFGAEGMEAKDVGHTVLGSLNVSHACVMNPRTARSNRIWQCSKYAKVKNSKK